MAPRINELDVISIKEPLEGPDVFDDSRILPLPAGTQGTVVYVHQEGRAFEVEFLIFDNPADPEDFTSVMISVPAEQCELAWKRPTQ